MNRLLTHRPGREALAIGLFIGAVFYGDVFLGITLPAAILLLPLILLLRFPTLASNRPAVPPGLLLLSCTALPVVIQTLMGYGPRGKTDLVIYLPFVYAALTMVALADSRVADDHLHRSLLAGGVLCAVLIGTGLLAGSSFYFVPGQNPVLAPEKEEEVLAMLERERMDAGSAAGHSQEAMAALASAIAALPPEAHAALTTLVTRVQADGVIAPAEEQELLAFANSVGIDLTAIASGRIVPRDPKIPVSAGMRAFYTLKNRVRTPLGMSNYLAVMFVFLFNVMLHQRSRWAILFVVLVMATMSRTGMGFLLISVAFWIAHRAGRLRQLIIVGAIGTFVCVLLAVLMWEQVRALPGAESLAYRGWYLDAAGEPIAAHPIAGTPRSETVRLFGYSVTWNPHNSILHLLVVFGIIGTVAYAAYLAVVLRVLGRRARVSAVWRGITAGTVVMLLWSMVEVIVLSPAFELLIATLYSLANADVPAAPGIEGDSPFILAGVPHASDPPATPQAGQ